MSINTGKTGTAEDQKPAATPQMRFPEFFGCGQWKDVPIKSILNVRDERRVPSLDAPLYSLTIENGVTQKTDRYNREFLVRDSGNKKYKLVEPSDIVYNPSNLRWGAINYSRLTHPVVVSPIYEVLNLNDIAENFLEFIACSVSRDEQIKRFITKAQGTLVERVAVKIDDFLSTNLPVPPTRAEQKKIADCLSGVDDLITTQARKLDTLKAHKKGLMQQLFPREGETQPRLRFTQLQNIQKWEQVDFVDAIFFQEGPGIMAVDFCDAGVPLVRLSGLAGQSVSLHGCNYLDSDKVERKWAHFRLEAGDILVSCSASFGRPAKVTKIAEGAVFYTGLVRFRPKDGRLSAGYLEVFMGSPCFLRQAESFAVGGGIKHFGPTHLRQMKVPLPAIYEQQRIADCLTGLDDLIAAQTQKYEVLKTHKKGLMQQLFPSPAESP